MTPSKTYCPAPFVHFYHKGTPVGKTCCMARNTIIHKTSSKETWANSRLNSVRQDVLDDKAISDCEPCYKLEASGGHSDRQYYLEKYGLDKSKFNVLTGNEFGKPIDLDLRPSNLCNLGCRMCGPHFSSTLQKESEKLPELADLNEPILPNKMLSDDDIDFLITDNPNLKRIKFLGGEPTIMPEVYKILDIIVDKKRQPALGITTNCTNVNRRFIEYLKYFDNVTINMSIDGVGETLEYIRHPVKYKIVDKNSKVLSELTESVNINFVIQALNLHNLNDFINFTLSRGKSLDNVNSVIGRSPEGISPYYLPIIYRKKLLEQVLDNDEINHDVFKRTFKPQLETIYNSKEELNIQHFLSRNMIFDKSRNAHLYNIMPEIKSTIDEIILNIGKSSRLKPKLVEHYVEKEI